MNARKNHYAVTITMIVICASVYLLEEYMGGSKNAAVLIKMGARYNPAIFEGEFWRLFTPMFLHIGFMHLLLNLISLWMFGRHAERIYGSGKFLLLYLLAGISGNCVSFIFNPSAVSAGASTSIYGIMGAIVVLLFAKRADSRSKTVARSFIPMAIINIAYNFMPASGMDVAGHLGGLACGLVLGAMLLKRPASNASNAISFLNGHSKSGKYYAGRMQGMK